MERVAFLIEESGDRIGCLLNPESLVIQRRAGVKPRQSLSGAIAGAMLADDALIFTGGGETTLQLDLLFDVAIAGSTLTTEDVRELTAPLWQLAENHPSPTGYGMLPRVRFVWGKHWNIPGLITAVAERLEFFSPSGQPRRSWIRMGFTRVLDLSQPGPGDPPPGTASRLSLPQAPIPESDLHIHQVVGDGARPDAISQQFYNAPYYWKLICQYNHVSDPLHLQAGQVLQLPPKAALHTD